MSQRRDFRLDMSPVIFCPQSGRVCTQDSRR
jgi:hypothetical protein